MAFLKYKLFNLEVVFFTLQKMREPRPDWSPLGVNLKIVDEHPQLFIYLSPPPPRILTRLSFRDHRAVSFELLKHKKTALNLPVNSNSYPDVFSCAISFRCRSPSPNPASTESGDGSGTRYEECRPASPAKPSWTGTPRGSGKEDQL